nr:unnamed protein product [Callosobruchus analis]
MIIPALRLVISNICPTVPNGVIEDLMKSHGIKLLSRITYLRVGMPEAEYAHVLSFRRVVYIAPSEVTIPDTTTLSFEGTTYRIFLSTDGINCSYCQQPGHSQLQCPNKAPSSDGNTNANTAQQSAPTPQPNETQETPYTQTTDPTTSKSTTENSFQPPKPTDINLHTSTSQQVKRQLPISPEITESNTINLCQTTAQTKKKKTSGDLEELLEPASDFINSPQNTTKLNITEIADYIENAQKSKDIITISKNYTDDLTELEKSLSILHTLEEMECLVFSTLAKKLKLFGFEPYEGMPFSFKVKVVIASFCNVRKLLGSIRKIGRVTYVVPPETMNIPDSVEITHDGLIYRIFLSLDSQKCFKCKKTGHVAVQCPNTLQQSPLPNLNEGPAIRPSEKNHRTNEYRYSYSTAQTRKPS